MGEGGERREGEGEESREGGEVAYHYSMQWSWSRGRAGQKEWLPFVHT